VTLDWPAVVARQHAIVQRLQPSPATLERAGARVYLGEATLVDPHTVRVDGRDLRGERVLIAAGSAPVVPPMDGHALAITSDELLFTPDFPQDLVLIGAGAIGLEMASAFGDLGAAVTVIAREPEILAGFDRDVAAYLRVILESRGVTIHRDAGVRGLTGRPGALTVRCVVGAAERELAATTVCVAAGRRFHPRMLGAESLGFELGRLGLKTSSHLATSRAGVYAAGDAAGNVQLTPTAAHEGRIAATNALQGDILESEVSVVPQVVFTTPEIARVGLTHREARERGVACHVSTHDMRGASNGVATGEDAGYLKLVFEAGTERIVGVQMVSYAATELIQLAALAIRQRATADALARQLSVHPSHAERLLKVAAHDHHDVCEV
jgi:pyruvate/2-oxoglutarate dehydrogenase complex dihydrolipoamide dehydrogenase (E3) component